MDISQERFYGAKTEPIDNITVTARADAGAYQWQLLEVSHGGVTDTYQVLVDEHLGRDALATEQGAQAWWDHREKFGELHEDLVGTHATPMGAEQSNTNLIVTDGDGEDWVVKVFRKLEDGLNPDVELLSQIGDCPHVAGVRGWLTRDGATLAMMQQRIVDGRDGFELLQATPSESEAGELAFGLGRAIRVVHDRLATDFPTREVAVADLFATLHNHADELAAQSQVLRERVDDIHALYHDIQRTYLDASGDKTATVQRVHGDLHLGQTLHTPQRWYLIDFEGEPARPLTQRVLPDHPIRDVAGMVRSFGYAAAMSDKGAQWEQVVVDKLLEGYHPDSLALLKAYVVDKAAYEVVYEENNRPDWVHIPMRAITELLQG
ncbi:trehalose synthase [Corynebacterium cystitidis]|uniref:trehalose synthase n=1 Tax=Corynebacterium cystitidis TaxID=35757 RepID=UPI00211DBECE|nr:trehalose synthase [Corynebacterium cystitidis]